ncbi:MAG: electron transport complex subunit RsxC [bacterium]|nr:electron transport complex subunit RsxC [bacterium]
MAKTFLGGTHPPQHEETGHIAIERMEGPKVVVIPLQQHIGVICEPTVKVGDRVLMGQKIGDSSAFISAPVHSSVAGKVLSIENRPNVNGRNVLALVIENDFSDELDPSIMASACLETLTPAEIIKIIREAGIVGMGGAGFPTHAKYVLPEGVAVDSILLNGAECEPYLTADHRVMLEWGDEVVFGLRALMKVARVDRGYIGVENNKLDAINTLIIAARQFPTISIIPLQVKYPQGAELQLIDSCLGRKVPPGKLPMHVGVIVNNVHTAQAVAKALHSGMPSIERLLTVAGGCVERPGNILVRVGTTFKDILEWRGLSGVPERLISGGPMMGAAMYTSDVSVTKGTSGILALTKDEALPREEMVCVRCAKCVDVCPMLLHPLYIAQWSEKGVLDMAEKYGTLDCRECGTCEFACPSVRRLTHRIRLGKVDIWAAKKAKK